MRSLGTAVFVTNLNISTSKVEILIGRRSATNKRAPGVWGLPGGMVDPGESIVKCGAREVKEETGLDVEIEAIGEFQKAILGVHDHHPREDHITFWMTGRYSKGNLVVMEPTKHQCWKWWNLKDFFDSVPQVGEQVHWTPKEAWRLMLRPIMENNVFWDLF
jgi:ADP-ribose pyrophosphatase YjhB (NUDIX family)